MEQKNFDNSGSLFVNDRKATEKQPDYKGSITIGGQKYWLSGWLRLTDKKDGSGKIQFISLQADAAEVKKTGGFPTAAGGMLQAAASLSAAAPAARTAPAGVAYAQGPAPAQAPAPAPIPAEEPTDDLPF